VPLLLPFFKFYVLDWITSEKIATMETPHIGAYSMLLAHCWAQATCSLPNDPAYLKTLSKWDDARYGDFEPVLACFPPLKRTGRVTNPRLYAEWIKAKQQIELLSESGQKGAAKRWAEKPRRVSVPNGRDYQAESKEVLAFLNEKTRKHFREVDATLAPIQARLKSGVDVQTCRTLIMRKVHDWLADEKMAKFLRPETLFNKTKFEGYLGEVTK